LQIDCIDERPGAAARLAARVFVSALTIDAAALIRARVELEVERLLAEQEGLQTNQASRTPRRGRNSMVGWSGRTRPKRC